MSSSSGSTSDSGWSSVSDSAWPISFSAERFRMPTLPEASTPMMPALAEDSTASMKRRRLSIRSRGADQFVALGAQFGRHLVEGLAELREVAFGFAGPAPGRADRRSRRYWPRSSDCGSAPPASWRSSARSAPTPSARSARSPRTSARRRPGCRAGALRSGHIRRRWPAVCLQLADHPRIEQPRDVRERCRRRRAADDRRDVVLLGEDRDLPARLVDVVEERPAAASRIPA